MKSYQATNIRNLAIESTIYLMNSNAQYIEYAAIHSRNKKQQLWDKTLRKLERNPKNLVYFFQKRKKRTIVSGWENLMADLTMCQIHGIISSKVLLLTQKRLKRRLEGIIMACLLL